MSYYSHIFKEDNHLRTSLEIKVNKHLFRSQLRLILDDITPYRLQRYGGMYFKFLIDGKKPQYIRFKLKLSEVNFNWNLEVGGHTVIGTYPPFMMNNKEKLNEVIKITMGEYFFQKVEWR